MAQIEDERLQKSNNPAEPDENEIVREIGSDYAEKYGFHNGDTWPKTTSSSPVAASRTSSSR